MGIADYTIQDKKLWESGRKHERDFILKMLQNYFELTQQDEVDPNSEWDRGFQAAIALVKNEYNYQWEQK
jgi:hypothetical protein